MIKLSVIVPCYQEKASIIPLLQRISEQENEGVELEVIVVDDGSTDGTTELLQSHPDLYHRLIISERNRGKGDAVRKGLAAATGTYVLFQDADLEYDPADYHRLLLPVLRHDADIVFGTRMAGFEVTRVAYFWHRVGNWFITNLFNVLYNTTFSDIYSGFFLLRRSLFDGVDLKVDGWAQQAEILGRVVRRARRIYEVPINYFGRTFEEGKKIRWYHALPVMATIVSVRVSGRAGG